VSEAIFPPSSLSRQMPEKATTAPMSVRPRDSSAVSAAGSKGLGDADGHIIL
jgi:hypothetical protein